jgi:hypothetical protein
MLARMNTNQKLGLVLVSGASLAMLAGCGPGLKKGDMAPDFALNSLSGESVTLAQYRGNVVVLGFWAVG